MAYVHAFFLHLYFTLKKILKKSNIEFNYIFYWTFSYIYIDPLDIFIQWSTHLSNAGFMWINYVNKYVGFELFLV
jgi:hypothetical protein